MQPWPSGTALNSRRKTRNKIISKINDESFTAFGYQNVTVRQGRAVFKYMGSDYFIWVFSELKQVWVMPSEI